jgi:hypothetical protein
VLILVLVVVAAAVVPAQDLSLLGQDFDTFVHEFGQELLPDLSQAAIWGVFPGTATFEDDRGFFVTLSMGAMLTDGIFKFAEDGSAAFEVLDLPEIINTQVQAAGAQNLFGTLQSFFPIPVLRVATGFRIGPSTEFMIDITGFPQLITDFAAGLAGLEGLRLNALHVGTKVRQPIVEETEVIPAISIGGGYTYSGFQVGYPLGTIGTPVGDYGSTPIGTGWTLYLKGDLLLGSSIHSFGVDLQASKQFGVFAPFIGLSPYYQIASFNGNIGGADPASSVFDAYIDYNNGGPARDVDYDGDKPIASWVDNDLSLLLTGGVDLLFGGFVLELHGSWNIGDGSPGARIGFRFQ